MLKLQRQLLKAKSFSSSILLQHAAPNTTVSSSLRKFSQNILARQVNIETVKQLRKETDAPLGQIRKALEESNGDVEAAKEWLRKKGVQTAQKKASREAANGLVALRISEDKKLGIAVEVNSETDFVAMNEKFKAMVSTVANALITHYNKSSTKSTAQVDVSEAKEVKAQENRSIQQVITDLIGSIGENIVLRRIAILKAGENEQICQYVHNDNGDSAGSIGTLVSVSFKGDEYDAEDMDELGRQVAMHVTGATPQFFSMEQIPKETIEKEKEDIKKGILQELETVTDEKKKQKSLQHVDKMVEGKLNKHLSQNILLEQPWAMGDGKTSVKTHLAEHNMQVNGFLRYKCGAPDMSFYSDKI